jgi:predicted lipoprotein with Yx(FWY)xxD motif
MRNRWWAVPILAAGAALLAACGSSSASPSASGTTQAANASTSTPAAANSSTAAAGSVMISTRRTSHGTVLTDAEGRTLYWFAIDTPTMSKCTGSCATYWPPVIGKPTAAAGASLSHALGTITRSNGQVQATYDGHPLYTYVGDTRAGSVKGNGIDTSGGLWWAATPSGAKLSAPAAPAAQPSASSTSSSSGGGYGY